MTGGQIFISEVLNNDPLIQHTQNVKPDGTWMGERMRTFPLMGELAGMNGRITRRGLHAERSPPSQPPARLAGLFFETLDSILNIRENALDFFKIGFVNML